MDSIKLRIILLPGKFLGPELRISYFKIMKVEIFHMFIYDILSVLEL